MCVQYQFEAMFLEIYNETIRDLLGSHAPDVKHEIKLTGGAGNDVTVTNLTTVNVTSEAQVTDLLFKHVKALKGNLDISVLSVLA